MIDTLLDVLLGTFQYPQAGSYRCNLDIDEAASPSIVFQYPQAGSYRCNIAVSLAAELASDFQYPQAGSYRCNFLRQAREDHNRESFSTLKPGRIAATPANATHGVVLLIFQYPQAGSYRCNFFSRRQVDTVWIFQYPQAGSYRCN